ncbi:uncharacterized protein LOC129748459 [Uranotaenia lowii]|uniref:uncharacterized protein LOC129748459 n=1 Tax=Uranotaenia lowii TaxID=190385 RepID=UPI0024783FC3|nr:uncharacterized protein LOC129748459 [Uranotaenia lowii]XP_055599076.1 uncharacterized protein LOC129748459 [Uranotaenia lowii]
MNNRIELFHLSDEEIAYELALRHVTNLAPSTRRAKVVKLKALVQEDILRETNYVSSEYAMSPESNVEACQMAIQELKNFVDLAIQNGNSEQMACARSRLLHYRQRLSIIPPVSSVKEARKILSDLVEMLISEINSAVNKVVRSDSGNLSGRLSEPISEIAECRDEDDNPSWGQAVPNRRRGATGQAREQVECFAGKQQEQEDVRSPTNFNIEAEVGSRSVDVIDELRVDLQHRQRRQRNLGGSSPHSSRSFGHEEQRMVKAIHNWPFKFRGEKDTTSLNIFLDRVETFARSEGLSDRTILASVKHLLLEDALDWYSRALAQGLLLSWSAFKREIRREFLPSGYAQILRQEASFRYQGPDEPFGKFYRDISTLFRFIEPPLTEEEMMFMVKKNMNMEYATIVTARQPRTLVELLDVCSNFDETRLLLSRQRRIPIPHTALLEPNFATPAPGRAQATQHQPQRFNRVHAVEADSQERVVMEHPTTSYHQTEEHTTPQDFVDWQEKYEQLYEQVCAMKLQLERRPNRFNTGLQQQNSLQRPDQRPQPSTTSTGQNNLMNRQGSQAENYRIQHPLQQQAKWAPRQQQQQQQQPQQPQPQQQQLQRQFQQQYQAQLQNQQLQQAGSDMYDIDPVQHTAYRPVLCWNCDEEGHRFPDCTKAQAILFCYRCGRKGYTLRSCLVCNSEAENAAARKW